MLRLFVCGISLFLSITHWVISGFPQEFLWCPKSGVSFESLSINSSNDSFENLSKGFFENSSSECLWNYSTDFCCHYILGVIMIEVPPQTNFGCIPEAILGCFFPDNWDYFWIDLSKKKTMRIGDTVQYIWWVLEIIQLICEILATFSKPKPDKSKSVVLIPHDCSSVKSSQKPNIAEGVSACISKAPFNVELLPNPNYQIFGSILP